MAAFSLSPLPPTPPHPSSSSRLLASCIRSCHATTSAMPSPSPSTHSAALVEIKKSGVIACLRAESGKLAIDAARAALKGGISVLEVVMSTPGVLEVVHDLVVEFPSSIIGVGTVLNAEDARNAVKAGAKFMMSPGTVMEILSDLQGSEVLYIPGVVTPTEILNAYNAGARVVKIYPVSVLGAARYISVLQKPFSHIPMVASQGITIDLIEAYIKGGAAAVVLSDAIFEKEAMKMRNFDAIDQLARCAASQARRALNSERT